MKKPILIIAILGLSFCTSCKSDKKETETKMETTTEEKTEKTAIESKTLQVVLDAKSESKVSGTATFTQEDDVITMSVSLNGLTEGTHAIHLHEKADCSSADGKSTGGHWNPTAQPHGKWGDATGYHKGDIGNFAADASGNATTTFSTNEWCIGCGDETKDILGKAIIVHQGTDDFTSQPSGAAGSRVSCGGIIE